VLVIGGWAAVFVAVFGSFVLGGGHVLALLQPFEFMCIFGAAIGAFVVSNPPKTLRAVAAAVPTCFKNAGYGKVKRVCLRSRPTSTIPNPAPSSTNIRR
jgi:chemotaxis protein MotA